MSLLGFCFVLRLFVGFGDDTSVEKSSSKLLI